MPVNFLLDVFAAHRNSDAIVWDDQRFSYGWLLDRVAHWRSVLDAHAVREGEVVVLEADFSPNSVALFLSLIARRCIFVPLTKSVRAKRDEFLGIAQGERSFEVDAGDRVSVTRLPFTATHALYERLRASGAPGLVLFSSGSTGTSKAALHDLTGILEKFRAPRRRLRTIAFLLFDHIGGVNTMLYTLSNAGCLVTVPDRDPDTVLRAVEKYAVELLPTSPTFINLILLSEAYRRYDLASLRTVTYGTEPMPTTTLARFNELFPGIELLQTYGLSEVGILRSKSKGSDSLWVKIGGEGFETRVVDGILHIRARSAMLGYLNAPSPFTEDGWLVTGDAVEVDGEYFRILGRATELINVGGQKVYPAEVEGVIEMLPNVAEAIVYGQKNPITGSIVCARVTLKAPEEPSALAAQIRRHCRQHLESFKVPVRVVVADLEQHSERFKKVRRP